jgi:3-hydroxyacyl-CoA dehydrogenase/enoyl-CoA hydratase/3-hydroxybutyryl-CoA epimerase
VGDRPGFVVNRVLFPYLSEAVRLVGEGVGVAAIDQAMVEWGMPMGPLELLDEIGLEVALAIMRSLGGETPAIVEQAVANRWLGKKSGQGFYVYGQAKQKTVNEAIARAAVQFKPEDVQWRLLLPMINEATRVAADEGEGAEETVDLAVVLGLGLAPFRGGIMRFAATVGWPEIVRRMEGLAVIHGERFAPAAEVRARTS